MKSVKSFFRAAKYLGFLIFLFSIFSGCAKYRIEHVDAKKFMKRYYFTPRDIRHVDDAYPGPIRKYGVYVYDSQGNAYRGTKNLIDDTLLNTKLKKTRKVELPDTVYRAGQTDYMKSIHVYLEDSVKVDEGSIAISPAQIKDIKYYDQIPLSKKERTTQNVGRITLFLLAGFAIIFGLFALLFMAIEDFMSSCFIATMVYKDANAPEVVLLRKYRDEKLRGNLFGELFIRVYYKTSPKFVYLFKDIGFINRAIKWVLDKYVRFLSRKYGYDLAI